MIPKITALQGHWVDQLKQLPDRSVQCCVTSPPYWGLRSYLPPGHTLKAFELGQEKTPEEYVEKMVEGFAQVRRVLKDDGTLWLNLGDTYAGGGNGGGGSFAKDGIRAAKPGSDKNVAGRSGNRGAGATRKAKDLIGVPWLVAFALRADGWWLRQWMPWVKRNAMPESVKDRPATSCETFFLLTKSDDYFYDYEAVRKPPSEALLKQIMEGYNGESTKDFFGAKAQDASGTKARIIKGCREKIKKVRGHKRRQNGDEFLDGLTKEEQMACGSNRRNGDWLLESLTGMLTCEDGLPLAMLINTLPFKDAHYATFPPALAKPCVMAGSRPGDTVLDPFGGSGTVGHVALELGRSAVLIDICENNHQLIKTRCAVTPGLAL